MRFLACILPMLGTVFSREYPSGLWSHYQIHSDSYYSDSDGGDIGALLDYYYSYQDYITQDHLRAVYTQNGTKYQHFQFHFFKSENQTFCTVEMLLLQNGETVITRDICREILNGVLDPFEMDDTHPELLYDLIINDNAAAASRLHLVSAYRQMLGKWAVYRLFFKADNMMLCSVTKCGYSYHPLATESNTCIPALSMDHLYPDTWRETECPRPKDSRCNGDAPNMGIGRFHEVHWWYNATTRNCQHFTFGGGPSSQLANFHDSREGCEAVCRDI